MLSLLPDSGRPEDNDGAAGEALHHVSLAQRVRDRVVKMRAVEEDKGQWSQGQPRKDGPGHGCETDRVPPDSRKAAVSRKLWGTNPSKFLVSRKFCGSECILSHFKVT